MGHFSKGNAFSFVMWYIVPVKELFCLEDEMEYLTTSEIAKLWGVSRRRVTTLCIEGRLPGAVLKGKTWLVPEDVSKPEDQRKKAVEQ